MRLRHRQLVLLVAAALTVAVLVGVGAFLLIRSAVRERFVERISAETTLLAAWVHEVHDREQLQAFARDAADRLHVRVTLIAASGLVVADSATAPERLGQLENHAQRPEIVAARLRGAGRSFRQSATTNVEYFYSAALVADGGPVRYARIALPANRVTRVEVRYAWLIALVVVVSMLLFSGIGYGAVRRFSRPMERMTEAVERSAAGELELSLPRDGGLEISRLADAVQRMRATLTAKLEELGAERTVFASVVSGMQEGLLLIGPDRRVRLANPTLVKVLDLSVEPAGRRVEEVVRHPSVLRDLETVFDQGKEIRGSILRLPGSERVFEVHLTPLSVRERREQRVVLLLFFEITRLEKLETVRREFVANVSHELRTPLTSIKAFVESMIDDGLADVENGRKFLGIIAKHAERMSDLIEDLTDLSLIETGAVTLELRRLDASDAVRDVVEQLRPRAEQQGLDLRIEIPDDLELVADRRRLEQMLTNLVDNAIKFNREGGMVRVTGRTTADGPVLAVEDTGVGIALDSQDKIFNRFFRERRERPRGVGGTGLGLAIVKHLMRLHGGRVTVDSELGHGATFTLHFPGAERRGDVDVPRTRARV